MKVPFVDLGAQNRAIWPAASDRIAELVTQGAFILGDEVETFELRLAELCGTRHAVGTSSGTAALVLVLRALGIGPGSEVVTVANSFVATVAAIALTGADAVLVDVGTDELIDPGAIAAAVTPRTRAVVPVHLRGSPADVEAIGTLARDAGIAMVEDCAQAIGARVHGRHVGSFGRAGCFSLHPLKNLAACGDAGMVVTDDDELADVLRLLRNHGLRGRDTVERWGDNARLDAIQAAILNVKLQHLEEWNARRRQLAAAYRERLADAPVELPLDHPGHVYHHFVIRTDRRDRLRSSLARSGIETRVHYPVAVHHQPAARSHCRTDGALRRTERDAARILSLPLHPDLPLEAVDHVADCVRAALRDG